MHNRNSIALVICLMVSLLVGAFTADAASIKERMLARIPAINALKDKGLIGENNQGYLEYRSGQQPDKETVTAENTDRRAVYAQIARKEGVDVHLVEKRRANQIAGIGHLARDGPRRVWSFIAGFGRGCSGYLLPSILGQIFA